MPIGERPVGLDARDHANREIGLAREHAHGAGHGPGGNARQVAEERAAIETPGAEPLGDP